MFPVQPFRNLQGLLTDGDGSVQFSTIGLFKPWVEYITIFIVDILVLHSPYCVNVRLDLKSNLAFTRISYDNVPWSQPFQDLQGLLTDGYCSVQLTSFIYSLVIILFT